MMPEKKRSAPHAPPAEAGSLEMNSGAETAPLSLSRLRAAFAQMLGSSEPAADSREPGARQPGSRKTVPSPQPPAPTADPCEISPRTIVEAMLFVGRPDGAAFTAREMAAAMRGVSPSEIEAAVAELNRAYERDSAPYEITGNAQGYRLALRDDFRRMRDKFHGRIREARLSPAALEVLSVVAYNQPATVEAINELRGAPSGAPLNWLVRRKLVNVEPPAEKGQPPHYTTTDRFLQLFGLESLAALPRNEELEKI